MSSAGLLPCSEQRAKNHQKGRTERTRSRLRTYAPKGRRNKVLCGGAYKPTHDDHLDGRSGIALATQAHLHVLRAAAPFTAYFHEQSSIPQHMDLHCFQRFERWLGMWVSGIDVRHVACAQAF